jgi:hypothetical protein
MLGILNSHDLIELFPRSIGSSGFAMFIVGDERMLASIREHESTTLQPQHCLSLYTSTNSIPVGDCLASLESLEE